MPLLFEGEGEIPCKWKESTYFTRADHTAVLATLIYLNKCALKHTCVTFLRHVYKLFGDWCR